MAAWLRNLIMLVVMACWGTYIIVSLIRRDEVQQFVWYLPGAIYFALNPTWKKPGSEKEVSRAKPSSETSGE